MEENNNQIIKQGNGLAVAGFVLSFFISILGLVFSIIGLVKSKKTNSGKGLAIAGIIISGIKIIAMALVILLVIVGILTAVEDDYYDDNDYHYNYSSTTNNKEIIKDSEVDNTPKEDDKEKDSVINQDSNNSDSIGQKILNETANDSIESKIKNRLAILTVSDGVSYNNFYENQTEFELDKIKTILVSLPKSDNDQRVMTKNDCTKYNDVFSFDTYCEPQDDEMPIMIYSKEYTERFKKLYKMIYGTNADFTKEYSTCPMLEYSKANDTLVSNGACGGIGYGYNYSVVKSIEKDGNNYVATVKYAYVDYESYLTTSYNSKEQIIDINEISDLDNYILNESNNFREYKITFNKDLAFEKIEKLN